METITSVTPTLHCTVSSKLKKKNDTIDIRIMAPQSYYESTCQKILIQTNVLNPYVSPSRQMRSSLWKSNPAAATIEP